MSCYSAAAAGQCPATQLQQQTNVPCPVLDHMLLLLSPATGSERAYAVLALLLALGSWCEGPLQALDACDETMDSSCRLVCAEVLLEAAQSSAEQQLLIATSQVRCVGCVLCRCAVQVCAVQVCAVQVCAVQVCAVQVCAVQVCAVQV